MSKFLSAEDMKVKYNNDYLTKCSIFKRALSVSCWQKYSYVKIYITNTNQSHLPHVPHHNHQIEAIGQQSSQNCTTPTCIIMQKKY